MVKLKTNRTWSMANKFQIRKYRRLFQRIKIIEKFKNIEIDGLWIQKV